MHFYKPAKNQTVSGKFSEISAKNANADTLTWHLFIRTFQRIDCPLVWAIVSRRTGETRRLMILIVKRSRFAFEFKPETFRTKGTAIATKRLDSASIAIVPRRTDERLGHDLMRTIKTRFARYALIGRIITTSVCPRTTLKCSEWVFQNLSPGTP